MKLNNAPVSIRKSQAPYGYPASESQERSSMVKNKQKDIKKEPYHQDSKDAIDAVRLGKKNWEVI